MRPDDLTCLLRNLSLDQEAIVRTGSETMDWFQIGKEVWQGCILSHCLLNFYAEYIMQNAGLDESQAGTKIAGRNINTLTYADDTLLIAESEEELKSLLMKVKEESEKADLKLSIQKTKIMASGPITLWQIEGGKVEAVTDFFFSWAPKSLWTELPMVKVPQKEVLFCSSPTGRGSFFFNFTRTQVRTSMRLSHSKKYICLVTVMHKPRPQRNCTRETMCPCEMSCNFRLK